MLALPVLLFTLPLMLTALAVVPLLLLAVAALTSPVLIGLVAAHVWIGTHIVHFAQSLFS